MKNRLWTLMLLLLIFACGAPEDSGIDELGQTSEAIRFPQFGTTTWGANMNGTGAARQAVCNSTDTTQLCYGVRPMPVDFDSPVTYDIYVDNVNGGGWGPNLSLMQSEAAYYAGQWMEQANNGSPSPVRQWSVFNNPNPGGNLVFRNINLPTPAMGDTNLNKYVSVSFNQCSQMTEKDGFTSVNYPGSYFSCSYALIQIDWQDLQSRFPAAQFQVNLSQAEQYGIFTAIGIAAANSSQKVLEPGSGTSILGTGVVINGQTTQIKNYDTAGFDIIDF